MAERIVEAARGEVRLVYRVAVAPRSTIETLYVKKALKTIKERALSDFKIELLYLSQYYAKRMRRRRDEEVGLCKPQRPGEGRSPQTNSEGEDAKKLKEARERVLALGISGDCRCGSRRTKL